jgi:hypothetical protein
VDGPPTHPHHPPTHHIHHFLPTPGLKSIKQNPSVLSKK